jgi:hypothetical protein
MKKSELSSHCVICWGSACEGNFSAPVSAKSLLVPVSECTCRCLQELRAFFGHSAAANANMMGECEKPRSGVVRMGEADAAHRGSYLDVVFMRA